MKRAALYGRAPFRSLGIGAPCGVCRHLSSEHLVELGPARLCMESGCSCGRRSLAGLARAQGPVWVMIAVAAYFGCHLAWWALRGFRVVP